MSRNFSSVRQFLLNVPPPSDEVRDDFILEELARLQAHNLIKKSTSMRKLNTTTDVNSITRPTKRKLTSSQVPIEVADFTSDESAASVKKFKRPSCAPSSSASQLPPQPQPPKRATVLRDPVTRPGSSSMPKPSYTTDIVGILASIHQPGGRNRTVPQRVNTNTDINSITGSQGPIEVMDLTSDETAASVKKFKRPSCAPSSSTLTPPAQLPPPQPKIATILRNPLTTPDLPKPPSTNASMGIVASIHQPDGRNSTVPQLVKASSTASSTAAAAPPPPPAPASEPPRKAAISTGRGSASNDLLPQHLKTKSKTSKVIDTIFKSDKRKNTLPEYIELDSASSGSSSSAQNTGDTLAARPVSSFSNDISDKPNSKTKDLLDILETIRNQDARKSTSPEYFRKSVSPECLRNSISPEYVKRKSTSPEYVKRNSTSSASSSSSSSATKAVNILEETSTRRGSSHSDVANKPVSAPVPPPVPASASASASAPELKTFDILDILATVGPSPSFVKRNSCTSTVSASSPPQMASSPTNSKASGTETFRLPSPSHSNNPSNNSQPPWSANHHPGSDPVKSPVVGKKLSKNQLKKQQKKQQKKKQQMKKAAAAATKNHKDYPANAKDADFDALLNDYESVAQQHSVANNNSTNPPPASIESSKPIQSNTNRANPPTNQIQRMDVVASKKRSIEDIAREITGAPNPTKRANDTNAQQAANKRQKTKKGFVPLITCRFFANGHCKDGDACTFKHDPADVVATAQANPKKNIVCEFFKTGSCCKFEACAYSHDLKLEPCKFFHLNNKCRQNDCPYSHSPLTPHMLTRLQKLTGPCYFYNLKGVCNQGDSCLFSHDDITEEQRRGLEKIIRPCTFFHLEGSCEKDECFFAHEEADPKLVAQLKKQ